MLGVVTSGVGVVVSCSFWGNRLENMLQDASPITKERVRSNSASEDVNVFRVFMGGSFLNEKIKIFGALI